MAKMQLDVWAASCVLLSLRITPVFLLAAPFTLLRVPRLFLVLMGLGFAGALASSTPEHSLPSGLDAGMLMTGAIREFFLGMIPVVVLQLLFGSLYIAGRTIDMQAGFGLALLIDPTTRGQVPLAGTIFAYALGASFFAVGGHLDLLRFHVASLEMVPLGRAYDLAGLAPLAAYAASVSLVALGVAGAAIAALFLCDLVIAMLSRTVPQMNALLLGIQVKVIVMLAVLPLSLGVAGALLVRLVAMALETMPRLM